MIRTTLRPLALPLLPLLGGLLAKKAATAYALFQAAHTYGLPRLYRRIAESANVALATKPEQKRKFLDLTKAAIRAPTTGIAAVESFGLQVRVAAKIHEDETLRKEVYNRVPPRLVEAAMEALMKTELGGAAKLAKDFYDKARPKGPSSGA